MFREGDRVRLTEAARRRLLERSTTPAWVLDPDRVGLIVFRESRPDGTVRYLVDIEGYPLAVDDGDLVPA